MLAADPNEIAASCRFGEHPEGSCIPEGFVAKAKVAGSKWLAENFDQILSKQEGTRGALRGLRWTSRFSQLLGTTEKMSGDARLPVG